MLTDLVSDSPAGLESEVRLEPDILAQSDTWFAIKLQSVSVSNENLCMVINRRLFGGERDQNKKLMKFGNKSEMQICF